MKTSPALGRAEPQAAMAASLAAAPVPPLPSVAVTPPVSSSSLLRGGKSVQIEHNGSLYQLRATKLGKLILTK
ncbi:hemin uptake protein HemP [Aquabacterium sp. A7-Y]|uniref:hemin uptake protein HemP n=1 Tax=Aquabacterium sp. A7-Y TaxID=1349605 RepID=UPI0039FBD78E